ncbi:MAG: hypothetical protein FJ189_04245 [Gammaproteobacteria bacterium]|nr:hypothetical protein [Gammaproteobacteria bacterium]
MNKGGVCWLRWDWEVALPDLDTAVFVIPGRPMSYPDGQWPGEKNKEDRLVVLNRVARSVIDECRGRSGSFNLSFYWSG